MNKKTEIRKHIWKALSCRHGTWMKCLCGCIGERIYLCNKPRKTYN